MSKFNVPLDRLARLIKAQSLGVEAIHAEEQAISLEVVGADVLARDKADRSITQDCRGITAFQTTVAFGRKLHDAVTKFAHSVGTKAPRAGKYDLVFATPMMFRQVWQCRQVIDDLEIPQEFYLGCAFGYWLESDHTRIPHPSQLCAADVIAYVTGEWLHSASSENADNTMT